MTAGSSGSVKSAVRPGDEQVAAWLDEYARLKQSGATGGARRNGATATLEDLKERIAGHYTGLVESIARRFTTSGEPLEDLVQEGYLGLLSALDNYDAAKGKNVKFSTYATHFVAGAMRHCLRDKGKIIKEPAWLNELSGKVVRTGDALTQRLGRAATPAEIALALNLTEEAVEEILSTRQIFQIARFGTSSDDGDGSGGGAAGLVDPDKIRSDKHVTLQLPIEDRIVLEGACEKLKALEQKVLFEFFYQDLNQTEIAKKLDISCNYVSHILKNSTKKLRRILGEAEVRDRARGGATREASVLCPATGLYTAAHLAGRVDEELSRAQRAGYPVALVTMDLWNLPSAPRDRADALLAAGLAVKNAIRRVDVAGRTRPAPGADDALLALLPHTGETARIVAERLESVLLRALARERPAAGLSLITTDEGPLVRVGLARFPDQGRTAAALLASARGAKATATEEPARALSLAA